MIYCFPLSPQLRGWSQKPPQRRRAVVLTGQHLVSDTEVQLYQQVLQQMDYEVQMSRYAETSSFLRTNQGKYSHLRGGGGQGAKCLDVCKNMRARTLTHVLTLSCPHVSTAANVMALLFVLLKCSKACVRVVGKSENVWGGLHVFVGWVFLLMQGSAVTH